MSELNHSFFISQFDQILVLTMGYTLPPSSGSGDILIDLASIL